MACRRPMIARAPPDGEAARLGRTHRLGLVVAPRDSNAVASALSRFASESETLAREIGDTSDYTAGAIADQAARLFDLVSKPGLAASIVPKQGSDFADVAP